METDARAQTPVLVTFARPEESRAFRRRLAARRAGKGLIAASGRIGGIEVIVAHIGIGPAAAAEAAASLLGARRWWLVIAAGFAGGLDPRLGVGDVVIEEHPISPGARRIASRATPVETVAEKSALFLETKAQAVDMETATIASACSQASLPFVAVRAISDAADEPLPVQFSTWFDVAHQRVRPVALLGHLLASPRRIPPFVRFVRALPRVANALGLAVEAAIRALEHH
jgi:adenosylhomocysteine nucleosidase